MSKKNRSRPPRRNGGPQIVKNVHVPKVTMIVPVWNNLDVTQRLFESIKRFVSIPYKLVFVNNGSADGTREWLDGLKRANPEVIEVVHNHTNLGFARAMNQGRKFSQGHVLWLNNDCELLRPQTVEMLVKALESNSQIGAVGPVTEACLGSQLISSSSKYPKFHMARFLIGFCMLVREDVDRKIGPLDEGFNNAGQDDLDYSIRIRDAGYTLAVSREVFVHHLGGASQPRGAQYAQMEAQGRELLVQKHGRDRVDELFLPVDYSGIRVLVSVPVWNTVYPEAYMNHVGQLLNEIRQSNESGLQIEFAPMIRSSIVCARNELVRQAMKRQCTHLFFMDDDMLMPDGAIHKLVQANKPIVSGLCFLRTPPHFPSMFMDPDASDGKIFYISHWPEKGMVKVDNIGSACVLVRTDVFQKVMEMEVAGDELECPSCNHKFHDKPLKPAGDDLWYLYGHARPGEYTVGEDVFFCKLARQAGFEVWVDTSVEFGHIGPPRIYNSESFRSIRDANMQQFPGIRYTDYESARAEAAKSEQSLGPGDVAKRLGGTEEKGEHLQRLLAGPVGDGKHPGHRSAAGNKQHHLSRKDGAIRAGGSPI